MFFQEATPDTSGYMIAGYVIAFLIMALYVASMYLRSRNLKQDMNVLIEVEENTTDLIEANQTRNNSSKPRINKSAKPVTKTSTQK